MEGRDSLLESDGASPALANDPRRSAGTVLRFGLLKRHVKRHNNDVAEAEAIREAVTGPSMRFVATETADQQSSLTLRKRRLVIILAFDCPVAAIETNSPHGSPLDDY
jgi:hypothetical protein